ncbi:response regulator [Sphingobacterium lactis]|uniref:response regulator n=1 Tax=Sphingobacterium lactis TaxID=797291 RepID=UPI003F7DCE52
MALNKILIYDDPIVILNTLEAILQENVNAEISTESHSPNVIRRLLNESINFLIVDLSMPTLTGQQLIRNIRDHGQLQNTFILCMSANKDGQQTALEAGADVFLAKPFGIEDLLSIVAIIVGSI